MIAEGCQNNTYETVNIFFIIKILPRKTVLIWQQGASENNGRISIKLVVMAPTNIDQSSTLPSFLCVFKIILMRHKRSFRLFKKEKYSVKRRIPLRHVNRYSVLQLKYCKQRRTVHDHPDKYFPGVRYQMCIHTYEIQLDKRGRHPNQMLRRMIPSLLPDRRRPIPIAYS